MRKRTEDYLNGNLTAMIDVVFQLIIFFVCTTNMQEQGIDTRIRLSMAPHGEEVRKKNPLEITVDVDRNGRFFIARTPVTETTLISVLRKAAAEYGASQVPVIIRGDDSTKHEAIRRVLDACSKAGIWKTKFCALKERA